MNEYNDLIKDFEIRVIPKKFAANKVGEKIVIWETETKKTLYLQVINFFFHFFYTKRNTVILLYL